MKTRAILALTAAAGLAGVANAQTTTSASSVTMTVFFAGDVGGDNDGIVEPGERAQLGIAISWTGFNTVGSFTPAVSGATSGTLRGLGGGFVDLLGTGGVAGTWDDNPNGANAQGVQNALFDAGVLGTPGPNGLANVQFAQLPSSANGINTLQFPAGAPIWLAQWTPADYSARNVSFNGQAALAAGSTPFSVLFRIVNSAGGVGVASAFVVGANTSFVGSGNIPIAPAPSSLALLGLGALVAGRRRR